MKKFPRFTMLGKMLCLDPISVIRKLYFSKFPFGGVHVIFALENFVFSIISDDEQWSFCGGKGGKKVLSVTPFIFAFPTIAEIVTMYLVVPPLRFLNSADRQFWPRFFQSWKALSELNIVATYSSTSNLSYCLMS